MLRDQGPSSFSFPVPSKSPPPHLLLQAEGREWNLLSLWTFLPSSCPSHIWTEYKSPGFLFPSPRKVSNANSKLTLFWLFPSLSQFNTKPLMTFSYCLKMSFHGLCLFKTPPSSHLCPHWSRQFIGIWRGFGAIENSGVSGTGMWIQTLPTMSQPKRFSGGLTRSSP